MLCPRQRLGLDKAAVPATFADAAVFLAGQAGIDVVTTPPRTPGQPPLPPPIPAQEMVAGDGRVSKAAFLAMFRELYPPGSKVCLPALLLLMCLPRRCVQ